MNQNLGPEWISVGTRLPQAGQRIQGVQSCCVWEESFNPAQPLDRMTHWRPLANDFEYADDTDEGANKNMTNPPSVETHVAALHEVIAQRPAPRAEALGEVEVLKEYSERLVNKLEEKDAELLVAKDKLRTLVEQSIVGIYIIQDDQFVYVNPGMQKIFGWSEAEMISRTLYDFFVPEDQALTREIIREWISGGVSSIHYDLRVLHQSEAVLQVEVHGSLTDYKDGPR